MGEFKKKQCYNTGKIRIMIYHSIWIIEYYNSLEKYKTLCVRFQMKHLILNGKT